MNNRQQELLRILLVQEEGVLQIKDLSEKLDCAEKTVRNDLDKIEEFLLDYDSGRLIRKPGLGISIQIDKGERSKILQSLFSNEPKTNEERLIEVAYQLLTSNKPITLQHLSHRYYVPKATIKKDIETIAKWLGRFELELVSKQRLGNVVQGTELQKRNALAHLSGIIPFTSNEKNVVLDLFLPYEIMTVKNALEMMQRKFSIAFAEGALDSLVVHALIMVKRIRQREPIYVQAAEKEQAQERIEFQYASWFFEQLESVFSLAFPEEEKVYFTWHLISSKRMGAERDYSVTNEEEVTSIVDTLVAKISKLTLYQFDADVLLKNGLIFHLHSVINRVKYGFPITNPLLSNIKKMYPYMFNMVILAFEEIKKIYHLDIPEDEVAYIVLHFQASIERMENRKESKVKALIVCHMGIGMSRLLEAKIEQQYKNIEIVACIGKSDISSYLSVHQIDFIFSTVPLESEGKENVVISPLFSQEDKKKLSQFVNMIEQKGPKEDDYQLFSTFIMEDLVCFGVQKDHRYEIVEMLATLLYENGYVTKEFIHSAVNRERKSSTAIGGGIAIPHGSQQQIHKSAIAIALLKEPLEWESERVSIVFMLAISKEYQGDIRKVIGKIASLSENPLLMEELSRAKNYQTFLQLLEK